MLNSCPSECAFVLWHDYRDRLLEQERQNVLRVSLMAPEEITEGEATLMRWLFGHVVDHRV